jgi:hypothetical protein
MHKKDRSPKKSPMKDAENVCSYCLFFQPHTPGFRPLQGNCTYHKEWIENASHTTCSDMSSQSLKEPGIYTLARNNGHGWLYIRREKKLRTRLFLVK